MPLQAAKAGSEGFKENIKAEIDAGKPQRQAIAIAYSMARKAASKRQQTRSTGK